MLNFDQEFLSYEVSNFLSVLYELAIMKPVDIFQTNI